MGFLKDVSLREVTVSFRGEIRGTNGESGVGRTRPISAITGITANKKKIEKAVHLPIQFDLIDEYKNIIESVTGRFVFHRTSPANPVRLYENR